MNYVLLITKSWGACQQNPRRHFVAKNSFVETKNITLCSFGTERKEREIKAPFFAFFQEQLQQSDADIVRQKK